MTVAHANVPLPPRSRSSQAALPPDAARARPRAARGLRPRRVGPRDVPARRRSCSSRAPRRCGRVFAIATPPPRAGRAGRRARSGKSGGVLALRGGIAVSLERMNRILEVSPGGPRRAGRARRDHRACSQAEVERHGLFYPPDPELARAVHHRRERRRERGRPARRSSTASRASTCSASTVVLPDRRDRSGPGSAAIKGVAGYDLTALLVGSEGTLGIVTEVTLKLLPRPRHVATALVVLPTASSGAARAVTRLLARGVLPRCLELLDDVSLAAVARTCAVPVPAGRRARRSSSRPTATTRRRSFAEVVRDRGDRAGRRARRGDRRAERGAAARDLGDAPLPVREPAASSTR